MLNLDMNELNVSPHVISKFKFIVSRLVSRCSFYVLAPMLQQVHFIYGQNLKRGSKKSEIIKLIQVKFQRFLNFLDAL